MTDWKKAAEVAGIPAPERLTGPLENLEASFVPLKENVPAAPEMAIKFAPLS